METKVFKGFTLSDFNVENLAAVLNNSTEQPEVSVQSAPYGQVFQFLADPEASYWKESSDFAVVWTRPQGVVSAFKDALEGSRVEPEKALSQVDEFASLLTKAAARVRSLFVPSWVQPPYQRGYGLLDLKHGVGLANLLMRMNLQLAVHLERVSNAFILDASRWVVQAGKNAFNPKLWYMGKIGFGSEVFKEAGRDIRAALSAVEGQARKLVILDLDDTLWGGIVGDAGWENLILGGHHPEGEALVDFQKSLKALSRRGILLAVASKNTEAVALEAIEKHPEMYLKLEDFAAIRINWQDKAQNIAAIAEELNLGLQSVVFIDDNPIERARVRDTLPEVLVPEWPKDRTLFRKALLELTCFDTTAVSQEDLARSQMYIQEKKRSQAFEGAGSVDDWLKTLGIVVKVEPLHDGNLARAAQLLNKTNQMNLSTRRMTEKELVDWSNQEDNRFWTLRVSDRFGDSGLTGLLSITREGNLARIVDFVLSCRVMGRKVEETMAALAVQAAQELELEKVAAVFVPTEKNVPCKDFWERSGYSNDEENSFTWDTTRDYPFPEQVKVEVQELLSAPA